MLQNISFASDSRSGAFQPSVTIKMTSGASMGYPPSNRNRRRYRSASRIDLGLDNDNTKWTHTALKNRLSEKLYADEPIRTLFSGP